MLSGPRALTSPAFSLVSSLQGIKPSHLDVSIKHKVMPLTHMLVCCSENVCVGGGGVGLWIVSYVDKVNYPCSRRGTFWF